MSRVSKIASGPQPPPVDEQIEAELQKDVWDVRRIPGARYLAHRNNYTVNFADVPPEFRPVVKRYVKLLVVQGASSAAYQYHLQHIRRFLRYLCEASPGIESLRDLSRRDVEAYLADLHNTPMRQGMPASRNHVFRSVSAVRQFLEYLERTEDPLAPATAVSRLVWPEDAGRMPAPSTDAVKAISEHVLAQLESNLHLLTPNLRTVIAVLRASGWRLADVLNLRHDTCLERTVSGWWLVGDIVKTDVRGHRVPITDDVARAVATHRDWVREQQTDDENPHRYLFPSPHPRRTGEPMNASSVSRALSGLVARCDIRDETGRLAHIHPHAFRHTKGVELINNGMSLLHVQKWMAHTSPQMTLTYARILDPTMRQEWERAFADGAVRIDANGIPDAVPAEQVGGEDQIEWDYIRHNLDAVRLPNGYCFKPKKADCPTQAIPCHTCHHFCTTPAFLAQFVQARTDALQLIELGERARNTQWADRNRQNLARLEPIIELLERGKLHHPAGKSKREYPAKGPGEEQRSER